MPGPISQSYDGPQDNVRVDWAPVPTYVCRTCGSVARSHPQTNHIWGCYPCGYTTAAVASYFRTRDEPADARELAMRLAEQRADATNKEFAGLENQVVLTCVYCGHAYPPGTPAAMHPLLTEHIARCDKHPMKAVVDERDRLRHACQIAHDAMCQASFVVKNKPEARDLNHAIDLCRNAITVGANDAI